MTAKAWRCALLTHGSDQLVITGWHGPVERIGEDIRAHHAAFIVPARTLPLLRTHPSTFVDRHRKHAAKSLSERMLGHAQIPLIDGQFRQRGQLERSVRTLLVNAAKAGEHHAYVIGVSDSLFAEFARHARAVPPLPPHAPRSRHAAAVSMAGEEGTFPAAQYLTLIHADDMPAGLDEKIVGGSPEMNLLRQMVVLASRQSGPVLILGETGTGKEVAARAVHDLDPNRRHYNFVPVNCGAISPELFESELFGHEPGAFTGARVHGKDGLWTAAGRGTIFLDEVGDLPLPNQVKILRALESNEIRRVGSTQEIKVHARVVAATNRDLFAMVQAGTFREDLFYRLRQFMVRTPRLCDHPQDISVLAEFFWNKVTPAREPLSGAVLRALEGYRWPGNARELRAVLFGLAGTFPNVTPKVEHLRAVFQLQSSTRADNETLGAADDARVHRVECLRHLRRTDEVIRACKVTLRSLAAHPGNAESVRRVGIALAHRLSELQVLSMQPMLFHTMATFDVVHRVTGGLAMCQSLMIQDGAEARRYWKKSLGAEVTAALSTIMAEVERLLKKL